MMREILFCVLEILSGGSKAKDCHRHPRAVTAAYAIQEAHREYPSVPPRIIAAVMAHESGFDPKATGALGEIGYLQLLKGGAISGNLLSIPDRYLYNPRVNILIGTKYLLRMKQRCGGSSSRWLSAYNGRPCGASSYSKAVLDLLKGS